MTTGDVFTLPIGGESVAVGQVVEASLGSRQVWVAIFWPPQSSTDLELNVANMIGTDPVLLALTLNVSITTGRWQRLRSGEVTAAIPWPVFKEASQPGVFHVVDHKGVRRRLASPEEVESLPYLATVSPKEVEVATAALAGLAEWEEDFNDLRPGANTELSVLGPQ